MGDSTRILASFRSWVRLHEQYLIDGKGTRYYVRHGGRGTYYLDNVQIGPPKPDR